MDTRAERAEEFFAPFEGDAAPQWTSIDDLARQSIESLHGEPLRRTDRSVGTVHLAGAATEDHSSRARDLGRFLTSFQRTLSAIGASLEGAKSAVGPLSGSVLRRTAVRVDARMAPGSLVLNVFAESDPVLELRPRGEMFDVEAQDPLVDRSVEELARLIVEVGMAGDGDEPSFVQHMRGLGPRVANAVRVLAEDIGEAGFDMEVDWRPPMAPSQRIEISPTSAEFIRALVERRHLDAEPVIVDGIMHTPSDRPSKWEVETAEYGMIRVKHDGINPAEAHGLAVGMRVQLHLDRVPVRDAAGETHYEWVAYRLDRLDDTSA